MPKKRPPQKPIRDPYIINNYTSWLTPKPSPEIEHFDDAPVVCVTFSSALVPYLLGLLETVKWLDKWQGSTDDKYRMVGIVNELQDALIGGNCMPDPCCPEEIEILNDIKTAILAISTNLEISIDNDTTIINQNTDQLLNTYQNNYNNWVTNNQNVAIYNKQIYDGNPQSISPNLGENFDDTSEGALCAAIKRYIENDVANYTAMLNLAAAAAGLIAGAAAAAIIALTAGAAAPLVGAWGMILGAASTISVAAWNSAAGSPEAKRKVACCMFDSLQGGTISQATFAASVNDCEFDPTTAEGRIAGRINDVNQSEENFLAFLRMLGQETGGSAGDCACDCDDDIILSDYDGTGCVITPMGNCIYRFVQSTPIDDIYYYFSFKDDLGRCLLVEESPDPTMPTYGVGTGTSMTDCDDVYSEFVGGFGGELKQARWWNGYSGVTYYKITLAE